MFGVSHFSKKVAVIAGAEHPVGASLCRRLAGFGAMVVAIGQSQPPLIEIARHHPDRIETLAFGSARGDILELLRQAWDHEPLHFYADFGLLQADVQSDLFTRSAGLAVALTGGLQAARGLAVIAVPEAPADPEPRLKSVDSIVGYDALLMRLSQRARPARFVGLRLPSGPFRMSSGDCVSAGDMALTLFHPVSRGLKGGSVVDWSPEEA